MKPQANSLQDKGNKSSTATAPEGATHQSLGTPSLPSLPKIPSEGGFRTAHQKVLSNGVMLVVLESHLSPVVQMVGAIKAGEVFDPSGKKGISAVTAAALNYGSVKRTRMQMMSLQEDNGLPPPAMLRFESGQETIIFRTRCLSRDLGSQLGLIGEILSTPGFQETDVDRAKQDVLALMKRQQDEVESKVNRALLRSIVSSSSPYCPGDPVDRLKSISKLTPDDLKDFQAHFLNPGSSYIVIAGDVTLNQAVLASEKYLSAWTGRGSRQLPSVQASSKRVLRTSVPLKEKSGTMLCFGQLVPLSRNHQDYATFLLADCALTNHPIFSRLGQLVNNEPQMANAVGSDALESDVEAISNAVEWSLTFSPEPNAVPYVVRTVQNELRNFTKNGLTQMEVGEVKRYLLGAIPVRSMSTIDAAADNVLESILQGGEPDFLARILAGIKGATADSVNKLIRTTFRPDLASLVVAGSDQSIAAVRNQAEKREPSPQIVPVGNSKPSGKE
jgi:predicted Zn-dependent peptidase